MSQTDVTYRLTNSANIDIDVVHKGNKSSSSYESLEQFFFLPWTSIYSQTEIKLPPTPRIPNSEKFMENAFESIKYSHFQKVVIFPFPYSLLTYFLKSKTPSVIPFWRAFLMPMKGARSKVPLSGHFK